MGPPLRMGFYDQNLKSYSPQRQNHAYKSISEQESLFGAKNEQNNTFGFESARHHPLRSCESQRSRAHVRGRSGRFEPSRHVRKTEVPPAVPSFGNPLPIKPSYPQGPAKKLKKKKRTQNLLGLTPKQEEHEPSSEDDEVDEEAQYSAVSHDQAPMQQQGQTAFLESSSDIAAWVEERKRRYPTKARAEENRERQRKLREEQEQRRNEQKEQQRKAQQDTRSLAKHQHKNIKTKSQDMASKAKLKIERLRSQLEKEERRAARAEAKVKKTDFVQQSSPAKSKKRKRGHSDVKSTDSKFDVSELNRLSTNPHSPDKVLHTKREIGQQAQDESKEQSVTNDYVKKEDKDNEPETLATLGPLTPTSQPGLSDPDAVPKLEKSPSPTHEIVNVLPAHPLDERVEDSATSNATSTSSSELSVSSSSSEDDNADEGSASDESSTTFNEEAPDTTTSNQTVPIKGLPSERVDRLVEQEQEEETKRTLAAIVNLGEQGLLDEPK
ncbi:MAG: hypothetical protein Q9190_001562 [Brigantiaea leucoxantha]